MIKLNEYDKKLNNEILKRNLNSSKSNSNVSIALLLSKNGVCENTKKITSEPVKRKIYYQHKNIKDNTRSSRNSKSKTKQRTCSLDREALDRFKYFKSLCAIKPPPPNGFSKDETIRAKNTPENLRKYFEDLSNHEKLPFNKYLALEEKSNNHKRAVNNNPTGLVVDYKMYKNDENYLRRSSCSELNIMEKSVSDDSTLSSASTDSQLNLLKVSHNRIRNIEIKFDKPPENNDISNIIEKENNSNNGLEKMKSEKFKFPKLSLPQKEEIVMIEETEEDEELDDFLFFGKKESKNNCQYQGLTRQNRMMFFDSTAYEKQKLPTKVKEIQFSSIYNNNEYIANLPTLLPLNSKTNIQEKLDNEPQDNSRNNKQNTNSINCRHLKLEALSVIIEEDTDSYFSLSSPIQLASNSTTNMSPNSQIFNQQELFIVETLPQKLNNISKSQKTILKDNKQPSLNQISTISKNVSSFIKSKMSIFEVEKINNENKINSNFKSKINFNSSSKYRLKNLNEEKVKNM